MDTSPGEESSDAETDSDHLPKKDRHGFAQNSRKQSGRPPEQPFKGESLETLHPQIKQTERNSYADASDELSRIQMSIYIAQGARPKVYASRIRKTEPMQDSERDNVESYCVDKKSEAPGYRVNRSRSDQSELKSADVGTPLPLQWSEKNFTQKIQSAQNPAPVFSNSNKNIRKEPQACSLFTKGLAYQQPQSLSSFSQDFSCDVHPLDVEKQPHGLVASPYDFASQPITLPTLIDELANQPQPLSASAHKLNNHPKELSPQTHCAKYQPQELSQMAEYSPNQPAGMSSQTKAEENQPISLQQPTKSTAPNSGNVLILNAQSLLPVPLQEGPNTQPAVAFIDEHSARYQPVALQHSLGNEYPIYPSRPFADMGLWKHLPSRQGAPAFFEGQPDMTKSGGCNPSYIIVMPPEQTDSEPNGPPPSYSDCMQEIEQQRAEQQKRGAKFHKSIAKSLKQTVVKNQPKIGDGPVRKPPDYKKLREKREPTVVGAFSLEEYTDFMKDSCLLDEERFANGHFRRRGDSRLQTAGPDNSDSQILAFLSCLVCWPIGLVAIYYSNMAHMLTANGRWSEASAYAKTAHIVSIAGLAGGAITYALLFTYKKGTGNIM